MATVSIKTQIGSEDIAWYDGTSTFQRRTTTGGSITLTKVRMATPGIDVTKPPYNAVGDGSHDDTSAIQAAINSLTNGGTILLPEGIFLVSSLSIPQSLPIRIVGAGANYLCTKGTVLYTNLASGYVFNLTNAIVGFGLENIGILGNSTADGALSYSGSGGLDWSFRNVKVRGFTKADIKAVTITDPNAISADGLWITGITSGTCLYIETTSLTTSQKNTGNFAFNACNFGYAMDSQYGIKIGQAAGDDNTSMAFNGCVFSGSESAAMVFGNSLVFNACNFECSKTAGTILSITGGKGITLSSNQFFSLGCTTGINITGAYPTNGVLLAMNFFPRIGSGGVCVVVANDTDITAGSVAIIKTVSTHTLLTDTGAKTTVLV